MLPFRYVARVISATAIRTVALALVLCLASVLVAWAQSDDRPTVTRTLAFENATVISEPGTEQEGVTVVVRDGLITDVGADASIPYDARVIEADSLYIYAGFIDGFSHTGIDMPDEENGEVDDPGNPSPARAGVQPEQQAASFFNPTDGSVERWRERGITTAHVAPEGRMMPGQSALMLLTGETAHDALLQDELSLYSQFRGARGSWPNVVSPSTTMGVISMVRQVMREAERRQALLAEYEANPQGTSRPPRDEAHTALMSVLDGEQPVMFNAASALDVHRVLDLQSELGFSPMLSGLQEGFDVIEPLQEADIPLFLSLDLPERTELDEDEDNADPEALQRVHETGDLDEERANLEQRLRAEQERFIGQAATLHEAGITFGFSTEDISPGDFHEHLRMLIDSGVPEEAVLASLTTVPAEAFGVSNQLGRISSGLIANLVVTDAPLFDEETQIRHVVVDGHLYTIDAPEEGEVTGDADAVTGTWAMTLETPQGEFDLDVRITGDESGLSGTVTVPEEGEQPLESISFDGETLRFTVPGGPTGDARISGTVEGDTFDGTMSAGGMTLDVSGQRTDPGAR